MFEDPVSKWVLIRLLQDELPTEESTQHEDMGIKKTELSDLTCVALNSDILLRPEDVSIVLSKPPNWPAVHIRKETVVYKNQDLFLASGMSENEALKKEEQRKLELKERSKYKDSNLSSEERHAEGGVHASRIDLSLVPRSPKRAGSRQSLRTPKDTKSNRSADYTPTNRSRSPSRNSKKPQSKKSTKTRSQNKSNTDSDMDTNTRKKSSSNANAVDKALEAKIRAIFYHTDKNHDGSLNVREVLLGLRKDR